MAETAKFVIQRIRKFIKDRAFSYYEDRIPLKALITVDANPIPFPRREKREWREIFIGEVWGSQWQSAWFRFTARIPATWKGKEVVAVIDTGSEACLFDRQGNPICGLTSKEQVTDPFYRKALIPISKQAQGREKVELLVEAAANSTMGVQNEAKLKECSLAVFRQDFWDLYHDIYFLFDLATHLQQNEPRRAQIIYALNGALNLYCDGYEEQVRLSRKKLRSQLKKQITSDSLELSAVGHAHLDIAWLWPMRETIRKAGRTFSSALFYMKEYPEYKFGASQPQVYQFVKDTYPELFEQIKLSVSQGRWEAQGAMWVEPDCNLASGESLVRQILYGKRFYRDEFGVEVDNIWLPDTFGFTPALPQLMRKSGLKYFMSQKLSWNKLNRFPYHTFIWEGLDGSRVFAHFLPADTMNSTLRPSELIYGAGNFCEKDCCKRWLCLFGEGDGGGGPGRHHLELARRAQNCENLPRVAQEFARDFFRKTEEEAEDLPEWRGELYLETHRGTLTTCGRTKWYNRNSEFLLHNLEFLLLLNHVLFRSEYPAELLETLWKKLLLNQFHDILPGTTIHMAFQESSRKFEDLMAETRQSIEQALSIFISDFKETANRTKMLLLFNTTGFKRKQIHLLSLKNWKENEILENRAGEVLPVQKGKEGIFLECTLPAYGFTLLYRRVNEGAAPAPGELHVSKRVMENAKLRVEFSRDGLIRRIYDKEDNREVVAENGPANQLLLFRDTPYEYDAWDINPYYRETPPEVSSLVSVEVKERGPLCASLLQKRTISGSEVIQEIRLYRDSKLMEFKTRIDWRENQKMLRAAFPLNIHSDGAYFDVQFGNLKRPNSRNTTWEAAKYEVFAHKWVDLSEPGYGVALLNDCKYGHSAFKNTLELTLLRAPIDPDPQRDRGIHHFTYALLPHTGDFREGQVVPTGYFLNMPVLYFEMMGKDEIDTSLLRLEDEPLFAVEQSNVVLETIKQAEGEEAAVLRIYEAYGQRGEVSFRTPFTIKKAMETDLLENELNELAIDKDGQSWRVCFYAKPYEIKTIKVWVAPA